MPREKDDTSQKIEDLTTQVSELDEKIDNLINKLTKIEDNSNTIIQHSQSILVSSSMQKSNEIMTNTIADPNGFIARELANQLYNTLEKYQTT